MEATQYADINRLLEALLSKMKSLLGDKLVGLYLYGSLVWGDFDHDTSDIDMLAATATDVDEGEAAALKAMHADFADAHKYWDNRIEVQYLSLAGLKTFKSRTTSMANISPGEPFHIIKAGKDWLLNWYFIQEKGVTLYGPPPRTIIEPVSKEEYARAVVERVREWRTWVSHTRHSRPYQGYAVLTMCRALYAYRNGEQVSKKRAAAWAEKELPQWAPLIRNALEWRLKAKYAEEVDDEATYPEVRRFVRYVSDLMPVA